MSAILSNNLLKSQFAFHGLQRGDHPDHSPVQPAHPHVRHRKDSYIIEEGERGRGAVAVSVAAARCAGGNHGGGGAERLRSSCYGRQRSTSAAMSSVCGAPGNAVHAIDHPVEQLAAMQAAELRQRCGQPRLPVLGT